MTSAVQPNCNLYSQMIGPMVRGLRGSELETERYVLLVQGYRVGEGAKNKRCHQNPVLKWHWLWIDNAIDEVNCVTYWNTGGAPSVTQAQVTMKENVSVFIVEQE